MAEQCDGGCVGKCVGDTDGCVVRIVMGSVLERCG